MLKRTTKLRWRRRIKRGQQQVEKSVVQADKGLEKHVLKRFNRLVGVRRFVAGWMALFVLIIFGTVVQTRALNSFYQSLEPGVGGIYSEGLYGKFSNANPIYATDPVDASVSRLVFSGLMRYDPSNKLVNDLAESIKSNDAGSQYTVKIKENAHWHDGKPVTADDVVFTFRTIQKPDAESPLLPNWQKVGVKAQDSKTVIFELPHPLASFPHSLTTGVIPKHLLNGIPLSELRSSSFNTTNPVGSGMFRWDGLQVSGTTPEMREEQIGLVGNRDFYDGAPNLERFVIRAFRDKAALENAFKGGDVNAAGGLDSQIDSVSENSNQRAYSVPLSAQVAVFLRNGSPYLKSKAVRRAITRGTDRLAIAKTLGYPVIVADSPLLRSHIGYNQKITQLETDINKAKTELNKAGWKMRSNGFRYKGANQLSFKLYTQDDTQYEQVANELKKQWKLLGINVEIVAQPDTQLQSTIAFHSYDALLYGISVGSDPDVYAYWHSSQADPRAARRLNFSEYESAVADASLEAGRSRTGERLRATKYRPFLEAWREDAPAVMLYQPRYLYMVNTKLYGFEPKVINTSVDRYANVENWAVRQDRVDIY